MTVSQPRPATLAAALARAAPPPEAAVSDGIARHSLDDLLAAAKHCSPRWQGHSVLIAVATQIEAARLLVALDGLARRLVLLPPDLKPDHLAAVTRDSGADVIVCSSREGFAGLGAEVLELGTDLPAPSAALAKLPGPTEWLMLTSGTTGEPKIAVHTLAALTGAIPVVPPQPRPSWATFYDIRRYGGLQIFLRAMLAGGGLTLSQPGETVADHLRRLATAGVTHISGTPTHWRRALMSAAASIFTPRVVRLSGEIADQAILDGLKAAFPQAAIGHAYASTEAGVGFEVTDGREGFPASYLTDAPAGVHMRIVEGALQIRSSRMASAYAGRPDLLLTDANGWVDTGDMIEIRDGRCHFAGRRGGIINVGGLKVHPEEIEAVINRHDAVRQSRVRPRKSPVIGAIVVADIVLKSDTSDNEAVKQDVLTLCRANLPPHKIPAVVSIVPAIEMTAGGKVARSHA